MKRYNVLTEVICNVLLVCVVVAVALVGFQGSVTNVFSMASDNAIYRGNNQNCVSLMFNVYWGTEYIADILAILSKYNAKCTFFVGGSWAVENPEVLQLIHANGHEIGNHGYFHKQHSKLTFQQNVEEISLCNKVVFELIGVVPTLFAPPSGDFSVETLQASQSLACKTIMWTRDTIDWRDKDSKLILQRATKDIVGGEFILLHPTLHTLQSLEKMLQYYKSQNLTVATVSNNLGE